MRPAAAVYQKIADPGVKISLRAHLAILRGSSFPCGRAEALTPLVCWTPANKMGTSMTKAAGKGEGNHPHDCFTTGDFKKGKRLGSGAFSTVYLGRCAHPRDPRVEQGRMYAVKQIVQKSLTPEDRAGLKQEIEILKELDSDLVMKLFAVYENKKFFQLVTELVEGGELFERIVEKDSYSETEAKKVVYNLIKAVAYVHKHDIVHRDLKPENVSACCPLETSRAAEVITPSRARALSRPCDAPRARAPALSCPRDAPLGSRARIRCRRKGESTRFAVKVQSKTDVKAKHLLGEVSILRRVADMAASMAPSNPSGSTQISLPTMAPVSRARGLAATHCSH